MKCPKCKKSSELRTKRTLANGREVTRERYCQKCRGRFSTIEKFHSDIAEAESEHQRQLLKLEEKNRALDLRVEEMESIFRNMNQVMERCREKR